jgi:hypothetical protein
LWLDGKDLHVSSIPPIERQQVSLLKATYQMREPHASLNADLDRYRVLEPEDWPNKVWPAIRFRFGAGSCATQNIAKTRETIAMDRVTLTTREMRPIWRAGAKNVIHTA